MLASNFNARERTSSFVKSVCRGIRPQLLAQASGHLHGSTHSCGTNLRPLSQRVIDLRKQLPPHGLPVRPVAGQSVGGNITRVEPAARPSANASYTATVREVAVWRRAAAQRGLRGFP